MLEDYLTPTLTDSKPEIEYKQCFVDGENYPINQMVFDPEFCYCIHWSNIQKYVNDIEDLTDNERDILRANLLKQL